MAFWILLVTGLATASPMLAYKQVAPPAQVVLPKPLSPAESLAAITVPDGFEVELVAAEPQVRDPIDLAWGADGRLWVVEMADYPNGMDGQGKAGGRIRVLESTRGDGRYDKSTLFAEGLRFPTSVFPWRNGVLVTAVPDILLLEDTDGDGRADRRTPLFTGLGDGNQQHLTNGLQWSLDGWLHLANGNSGGKVSSPRSGRAVELGQRDFRIQPENGGIELLTGQSQVGRNRDDWGNWFGCNNSNPIWHFALEDHYLRRNPHLMPPNAHVNVAAVPGAARVFPRSATFARFNDPHGFNHFTSACGVMIYRDEWLGAEFAGNVFVAEPVHNLVHREIVRPVGATFKSERAPSEQNSEFFASTDNWSRFTAVRGGPDGALYIVDMYRLVIEHPKWIPDAWQKELGNLRAGEDQGRIYRVRRRGSALRPIPRLDQADRAGLVAALESPSGVVRDLAQQHLYWRNDRAATPDLERVTSEAAQATSRVQALWTLHLLGQLSPAAVATAMRDESAGVRRQAIRLAEGFAAQPPELLAGLAERVSDPDAGVRQQLAYTLGAWPQREAGVALARLLRADDDRYVRAAAMSSALPHAKTLLAELRRPGESDDSLLMEIAVATENADAFAALLSDLTAPSHANERARQFSSLALLLDWLQRRNKTLTQLQEHGDPKLKAAVTAADEIFAAARHVAVDTTARVEERVAAVGILGRARRRQVEDFDLLATLLTPAAALDLQLAAAKALAALNRPNVPDRLLAGWSGYGATMRSAVVEHLSSRPAWAQTLLDRLAGDSAMRAQIDASRRAGLTQHGNAKVAERATEIFSAGLDANRQVVVERYLAAVAERPGEAQKGATVFAQACAACHRFGAVDGRAVGPDLAGVKDRSAPYLLTHILDPNRAVEDRYIFYTATTHDGRALAGMLGGESGNSLTLIGLDGSEQTILRNEIRSLVSSTRSLMPEGLEAAIDAEAMSHLIAFLSGTQADSKRDDAR